MHSEWMASFRMNGPMKGRWWLNGWMDGRLGWMFLVGDTEREAFSSFYPPTRLVFACLLLNSQPVTSRVVALFFEFESLEVKY